MVILAKEELDESSDTAQETAIYHIAAIVLDGSHEQSIIACNCYRPVVGC